MVIIGITILMICLYKKGKLRRKRPIKETESLIRPIESASKRLNEEEDPSKVNSSAEDDLKKILKNDYKIHPMPLSD